MSTLVALAILAAVVAALWRIRAKVFSRLLSQSDLLGSLKVRVKEVRPPSGEGAGIIWLSGVRFTNGEQGPVRLRVEVGWRFRDGGEVTRPAEPDREEVTLQPSTDMQIEELRVAFETDDRRNRAVAEEYRDALPFVRVRDRLSGRTLEVELQRTR